MRNNIRFYAFAMTVMAFLALYGCGEELVTTSEFVIEQERIDVPVEGGSFEVAYTLENPTSDGQLKPVSEREWVHDIVAEDGRLVFTVDENTSFEARECRVEVLYTNGNIRQSFTVAQEAAEEYVFKINVIEVKETEVSVSVQPADEEMTYVVMAVTKSGWEGIGQSAETLFANVVSQYEYNADLYKLTLAEYLEDFDILKTGYTEMTLGGFDVETDYYVFAVGMSPEGDQLSELVMEPFTTSGFSKNEVTFTIDVALDGGYKTLMTVTPSDEETYYVTSIKEKRYFQEGTPMEEIAQNIMEGEISSGAYYGKTRSDVVNEMRVKGVYNRRDTLMQNETFYAMAFTVTDDGYVNSDVAYEEFTTGDVPLSDNEFTVSVSNIGLDVVDVTVGTANNDTYVCVVEPSFEWEGMSDEEILEGLQNEYYEQNFMHNGDCSFTQDKLMSGTEYTVFVFGYEVPTYVGAVTTGLYRKTFTTESAGSYDGLEFTWDFVSVGDRTVRVAIDPDPETVLYYCGIAPANSTEDMIKAEINALVEEEIDYAFTTNVKSLGDYMRKYGIRGATEKTFDGLYTGSEYKVYCVGVSDRTGEYVTPFMFSETVVTDEAQTSDLTIELVYDKYFDGTEVAKIYSELLMAAGYAILPIEVKIEGGEAVDWWFHVYSDDITDTDRYSDDWLVEFLMENGVGKAYTERLFFCPWNQDLTMIAVAKGQDGLYSNVFRRKINLSVDGASPADDFVLPDAAPASMSSTINR